MTEKKTNDKPKRQLELNRIHRLWHNLNLSKRALEPGLKERWYKIALLAGFSLLAAVMVFPRPQAPHFDYQVGDIAERDIKASADFLVEDKESTAKRQQEQLDESPLIFDLDERIGPEINARLHQAFEFMRQTIQETQRPVPTSRSLPGPLRKRRQNFLSPNSTRCYWTRNPNSTRCWASPSPTTSFISWLAIIFPSNGRMLSANRSIW